MPTPKLSQPPPVDYKDAQKAPKKPLWLWIFLFAALLLSIIWQFFPLGDAQARMQRLPLYGQDFEGYIVPLSPEEQKTFHEIAVIKRIYQIGTQKCFLYVLDGTNNRHLVHDPAYCFRGSGWEIAQDQPFPLRHGVASLVLLTKGNERKDALYWYADGAVPFRSPFVYWWKTTLRRLTLGLSGPEPVLVVIQPLDTQTLNLIQLVDDFPALNDL